MSKICSITGKNCLIGNSISHANNKTKRYFNINFFKKKFFSISKNKWIKLSVSSSGIRIINKLGLDFVLKNKKNKIKFFK